MPGSRLDRNECVVTLTVSVLNWHIRRKSETNDVSVPMCFVSLSRPKFQFRTAIHHVTLEKVEVVIYMTYAIVSRSSINLITTNSHLRKYLIGIILSHLIRKRCSRILLVSFLIDCEEEDIANRTLGLLGDLIF